MRILLIEDDVLLAQSLTDALEAEGFQVDEADCGEDRLELAKLYEYQVMILDLGLPDMRGDEVLQNLRQQNTDMPVLILSGDTQVESRLSCLHKGADDYLIKPFNMEELVARLQALVRRANGHAQNVLQFGDLTLNLTARDVSVGDTRVELTSKEYQMFELLCLRKGNVVSKESFLDHLYGGMDEPEMKIIDVFNCKLRKKIEKSGASTPLIQTVWGRGYRVNTDEMQCSA
ncbi:MAG: response regulator transcription factor [Rhodobiaceae bacterium]|nr:response regulator transcription factor [Rhodobiaceae bacterium]MBT5518249.1 response regulator transcription factor [Rhodobiaceae bacterium]